MQGTDFDIITFDCYGTLIDWEGGMVRAFQSEAEADGRSLNAPDIVGAYMAEEPVVESAGYKPYREVLAQTALRVASRLGWPLEPERAGFLARSLPEWQPFPDTNTALERLASRFRLGLLSNIDDDLLAVTRRHFTVEFDLIVTAQQVKSYKPGFAHFREGLARISGKRLLHAAQSYFHDVVPASSLGIPVVWVNRKAEKLPDGGPKPTEMVPDLASLAELLLGAP
jgi:2-haloacid dehalogenase/putative hydrolase of the HAD superfamily